MEVRKKKTNQSDRNGDQTGLVMEQYSQSLYRHLHIEIYLTNRNDSRNEANNRIKKQGNSMQNKTTEAPRDKKIDYLILKMTDHKILITTKQTTSNDKK